MKMNEQLKKTMEGAGIVAEVTKIFYDACVAAGFSEAQALHLAGILLKDHLQDGPQPEQRNL